MSVPDYLFYIDNQSTSSHRNQLIQLFLFSSKSFRRIQFTKYDIILLILNILMFITLIVLVNILKISSTNTRNPTEG